MTHPFLLCRFNLFLLTDEDLLDCAVGQADDVDALLHARLLSAVEGVNFAVGYWLLAIGNSLDASNIGYCYSL